MPQEPDLLDLPIYSEKGIAAANYLASQLPLTFVAAGRSLRLFLPPHGMSLTGDAGWPSLAGRLRGAAFTLTLDPALLPPMGMAHLAEIDAASWPEDLHSILLSILLQDIDALVEAWCGARPEWLATGSIPDGLTHGLAILHADGESGTLAAILRLDDDAMDHVARRCPSQPIRAAVLDDLPISLDLLFDRVGLGLAALRALRPGDIVLTDHPPPAPDAELDLILRVGNVGQFRTRYAAGRLTIVTELDALMDFTETSVVASLDDLELSVEIVVGQITLPLSRLRDLTEGQVLDLGFDATTAVRLQVNRQTVATGELVRILDRTGVRINELRVTRES